MKETWTGLLESQNRENCDCGVRLSEEIRRRLEERGFSDEWLRAWQWWREQEREL